MSACIHCCGPVHQSSSNVDDPSLSSSASSKNFVSEALSSIFKLNFLKAFDTLECIQKEEDDDGQLLSLLCFNCTDLLTNLYQLYNDFLQLGQIESILNKKLARLDEIIDCHGRKIIHCDLIATIQYEHEEGKPNENNYCDNFHSVMSSPPSSYSTIHQLCPKELKILLTRLPPNEFTSTITTTITTHEEEEIDNASFHQDEDDDYNPDGVDIKIEDDADVSEEFESPRLPENPLKTCGESEPHKPDVNSSKINEPPPSSITRNSPQEIDNPKNKRRTGRNKNNKIRENPVRGIKTDKYRALKGKFANPCWYCKRTDFVTPADCYEHTMKEHFSKIHNNDDNGPSSIFVCTRCSKMVSSQFYFELHSKICQSIPSGVVYKPFQCTLCSKSFATSNSLKDHMKCHSDARPFSCDLCDYTTKYSSSISIHQKNMHRDNSNKIKCDECESFFRNEYVLKYHKRQKHTIEGLKKYKEYTLVMHRNRRKEKRQANAAPVVTKCLYCDVDLLHPMALRNHQRTVHGEIIGEFTCDSCGKSFGAKQHLDLHIRTVHTDARPFICDTCGKSFKTTNNLRDHVNRTHSEEGRLKYNQQTREKNRRRKLLAAQLANVGLRNRGEESSSNSNT